MPAKKAPNAAKKAHKKSTPKAEATPPPDRPPIISLGSSTAGSVVSAVLRPASQGLSPALIVQGLEIFHVYRFPDDQKAYLFLIASIIVSAVQNLIEKARGRKLIGPAPEPGTKAT